MNNSTSSIQWLQQHVSGYLFRPTSPTNLAFTRFFFFGYLAFCYLPLHFEDLAFVPKELFFPISFFKWFHIRTPDPSTFYYVCIIWKSALVLSCLGLFTRISTLTAFTLSIYVLGLASCLGKIDHRDGLLVLLMLPFAFSSCSDIWSLDAFIRYISGKKDRDVSTPSGEYNWPLKLGQVLFAIGFFTAGMTKLRGTGWLFSDKLKYTFILHHYLPDRDLSDFGLYVAQIPLLCATLALLTVIIETGVPLAIFSRKAALFFVPSLFALQVGNAFLLGVHWDVRWASAYMFWVPWSFLIHKFRPTPANHSSNEPAAAQLLV